LPNPLFLIATESSTTLKSLMYLAGLICASGKLGKNTALLKKSGTHCKFGKFLKTSGSFDNNKC